MLCFMVIFARFVQINYEDFSSVLGTQSTRTLVIGEKRGEIYDRNFQRLVNTQNQLIAAVTPCTGAYVYLQNEIKNDILKEKI